MMASPRHRRSTKYASIAVAIILASCTVVPTSPLVIAIQSTVPSTTSLPASPSALAAKSPASSSALYAAPLTNELPPPGVVSTKTEKRQRNWKDGEYNSTLPSRLFYTYADPLLEVASERRLVSSDAFNIPGKQDDVSSFELKCFAKFECLVHMI